MRDTYIMSIFPTESQIQELQAMPEDEPVVMLNLLRFKERASAPDEGLSGQEAYERYGLEAAPYIAKVGARLLSAAVTRQTVIGPEGEWDMALLVEYPSAQRFLEMASDPGYLEAHTHRDAALADSRLIATRLLGPALS
jgi:uncharacterized protein (DUF1330 family)